MAPLKDFTTTRWLVSLPSLQPFRFWKLESPRITVVFTLVELSEGGTIGVEIVLSTTLIFPFPFSLGREVASFDSLYKSLERSLTTNFRDSRSSTRPWLRSFSAINSRLGLSLS